MRPANSELVSVAWLQSCPGIPANSVATQLPADNTTWAASGFVKAGPVVGGGAGMYVGFNNPVIQIEAYAMNLNSKNPAWDKAADLMEYIRAGTLNYALLGFALTLRSGYRQAIVKTAYLTSEPRRIEGNTAGYAVMEADLALGWVEIPG